MDATLGAGGHAAGILEASEPGGMLLGLEVDPQALDLARQKLAPFGERACLKKASYTTLPEQLAVLGWKAVDGILLDLGASSMQFDTPEKWGGEIKLNNGGAYFIEPQPAPERLPYSVRAKRLDAAE